MLDLTENVTGKRKLPGFSQNVILDEEAACYLHPLQEMIGYYSEKGNTGDYKRNPRKADHSEFHALTAICFCDPAQNCKTYEEFIEKMGRSSKVHSNILTAPAVIQRKINKLTEVCRYCGSDKRTTET